MGIQYLFKNLISEKKLINITTDNIENYTIFIDFSCIFYTFLYTCDSETIFIRNVINYIKYMLKNNNKLKIFIDKGIILIKEKERKIRKIQDCKCIEKIKDEINIVNNIVTDNEIAIHSKNQRLNILNFKLNKYNSKYRKKLLNIILSLLENSNIYEKKGVDAEFYMCKKIIKYTKKNSNDKILVISNDQDIFLFLLNNYTNNNYINIKYYNKLYKLIIDNVSKNISILTLFFNKSDYFGIKNYLYATNKIDKSLLEYNPEYTQDYIIKICKELLKNKINNNKKEKKEIKKEYIISYINQIIMYTKINYNIFNENIISGIEIDNIVYVLKDM